MNKVCALIAVIGTVATCTPVFSAESVDRNTGSVAHYQIAMGKKEKVCKCGSPKGSEACKAMCGAKKGCCTKDKGDSCS